MSEKQDLAELRGALDTWPGMKLAPEQFAAQVEALRRAGGALPEHLADLYLARAAAQGDAVAVRAFDERILAHIAPVVLRVDPKEDFIDEVRQLLRARLLVGEGGAPPRIIEYQGRGPLLGWVRVAAARVALNLKRASARPASTEDMLGELAATEPDPELRHLKTLYRAEFGTALHDALAALPERQRALLRLHYVDGLRLAQIARLYQVHESTVSRWVSSTVERVASGARHRLTERLALSPSSLDSVARMVQSHLDLSIRRILGGAGNDSKPRSP
jgi:RNA polymerase sigma-70 factor (ECF subfamily)